MSDEQSPTAVEWAVVATGVVTTKADIVVLKSEAGERLPIILGIFKDEEKAARMARRMASRTAKVIGFKDGTLSRGTPILGVQQVIVPFRAPRQTPNPEASANGEHTEKPTGRGRRVKAGK